MTAAGARVGTDDHAPLPMRIISRDKPVYASSETYAATNANSSDYSKAWRSSGYPCWLAYDLSSVPSGQRHMVYSQWTNNATFNYDNNVFPDWTYNVPGDYVIEANAAKGGPVVPPSGWVPLVSVDGNTYHSAAQVLDMTGYNWLRLRSTTGNPRNAVENTDCSLKWDIFDASRGSSDTWMFYGDSITAAAMSTYPAYPDHTGKTVDTFAKLVNAAVPGYFPAQQDGSVGGLTLTYAVSQGLFDKWLKEYPGKFVAVALGTNDANSDGFDAGLYHDNLAKVAREIERAGKVPVIPTLVASTTTAFRTSGPAADEQIRRLYRDDPAVVPGPDLWALFSAHPEWIGKDGLHPTDVGYGEIRKAWVASVVSSVYPRASAANP